MNPLAMLKIKPLLEGFRDRHPKFTQFLGYGASPYVEEGSIFEIRITPPGRDGVRTNFVVSKEDLELLALFKSMMSKEADKAADKAMDTPNE